MNLILKSDNLKIKRIKEKIGINFFDELKEGDILLIKTNLSEKDVFKEFTVINMKSIYKQIDLSKAELNKILDKIEFIRM